MNSDQIEDVSDMLANLFIAEINKSKLTESDAIIIASSFYATAITNIVTQHLNFSDTERNSFAHDFATEIVNMVNKTLNVQLKGFAIEGITFQ